MQPLMPLPRSHPIARRTFVLLSEKSLLCPLRLDERPQTQPLRRRVHLVPVRHKQGHILLVLGEVLYSGRAVVSHAQHARVVSLLTHLHILRVLVQLLQLRTLLRIRLL